MRLQEDVVDTAVSIIDRRVSNTEGPANMFVSSRETKPGLTALASELLLVIVEPLPRSALKSLRLTSRKLREIASQRMFESISVRPKKRSMQQLTMITRSTFWSLQVQYIEWTPPSIIGTLNKRRSQSKPINPELDLDRLTDCFSQLQAVKVVRFTEDALQEWVADDPNYGLLALIVQTRLKPARIETDYVTIDLLRDANCRVVQIDIRGIPPDGQPNVNFAKSFRRAPYILDRMAEVALLRPKIVTMEGVWLDPSHTVQQWKRFLQSPGLKQWDLKNVLLGRPRYFHDPLDTFMALLKMVGLFAEDKSIPMPQVSMSNVYKRSHEGCIDASYEEIAQHISDPGDSWLEEKQTLFTQDTPASEGWETIGIQTADEERSDSDESRLRLFPRNFRVRGVGAE